MADKSTMVSARLEALLVDRVDFVTRNTAGDATSRTRAIKTALLAWLPTEEREIQQRLGTSGSNPKKVRSQGS